MTTMTIDVDTYGRHSAKNGIPADDERTVADLVGEYWHALSPLDSGRHRMEGEDYFRPAVDEIRRHLALEREDLSVPPVEDTELVHLLDGPRRPPVYTALWWDEDTTGSHVIVKPYRPGPKAQGVGEPTVGILPISTPQPGEPGFVYDEPPIGHTSESAALDMTRVESPAAAPVKPKIPLWKQAIYGLLPQKWMPLP